MTDKKFNILLIGDSCIDEYHYGVCERLSPEAPVPVLKITHSETKQGMAANVKDNLEAFGCDVDFLTSGVKSIKRRYIDARSKQHIVRVDEDPIAPAFNPYLESLSLNQYDAIVISDYNKGFVTYDNVGVLRDKFNGPIFVDTKKPDLTSFSGCFVKINELEYAASTSKTDNLIVTLGSYGAMYKGATFAGVPVEVVDVCGAGDTFLAALAFEFLKTSSIADAIKFANKASAITVTHSGVYSLTETDIVNIRNNSL